MSKLKPILHPLFFAAYPILALLANNMGESRISVGLRALFVSLIATGILLLILFGLFRNWNKAAIVSTITLILAFSYGQVYHLIEGISILGINLGRHRILLPLYGGIFMVSIWWVAKKIRNPQQISEILNIIGLVAIAIPIFQITLFQINTSQQWGDKSDALPGNRGIVQPKVITDGQRIFSDVYYIVLDAYARGDTMKEFYNFNNDPFLRELEELGFYIADCSQSNYAKTRLSLASSLNMNYLEAFDEIAQDLERGKESRIRMGKLIRHNAVRENFEELGYSVVAFETGYLWSEWDRADFYLTQHSGSAFENVQLFGQLNDFEALLIRTTVGIFFMDAETVFSSAFAPAVTSPRQAHYDYVLYTLDTLGATTAIPSPKFVFSHFISPHGPYVFDADGNFIPGENDTEQGYIGQVAYLNSRLIPLLHKLIKDSETPPIIILQADHGGHGTQFDLNHRMNILNAYYLPDGGDQKLYTSISPVNSFRLVFDTYFGTDYGLLPDDSYYSSIEDYFDFVVVPNQCTE